MVDWSRGGLLLRVPSPRRRLLLLKAEPCVAEGDALEMTLHLPPAYRALPASGEVVHVRRSRSAPDDLLVGVCFDVERTPTKALAAMAKLIEPRQRSSRRMRQRTA